GRGPAVTPIHVLVHVVILREEHASRTLGQHRLGGHVKYTAPAGTTPGRARRQNRRPYCKTCFFNSHFKWATGKCSTDSDSCEETGLCPPAPARRRNACPPLC